MLGKLRYKFYSDGLAVMEHIEAYGMPEGTRAGYLLFYIFADHAMKEGVQRAAIGTGVEEKHVTRNLADATERGDEKAIAEYTRNMGAVHIYKELGFDATDEVTLSNSIRSVEAIRATAIQKLAGVWTVRVNQPKSECVLL